MIKVVEITNLKVPRLNLKKDKEAYKISSINQNPILKTQKEISALTTLKLAPNILMTKETQQTKKNLVTQST